MRRTIILFTIISVTLLHSCSRSTPYHEMEERELARDVRFDSLFFGLYLGMSSKDFYTHCWELNKQGLIRQGASNTSVYYQIKDFKHAASMDFYPRFYEDQIIEMPVVFAYEAWAPWNRHLFADSLKIEVLARMEEWYGPGFIEVKSPNPLYGNAFVKVDGNRRISIYNKDDREVKVDIVDLKKLKELEGMISNGETL